MPLPQRPFSLIFQSHSFQAPNQPTKASFPVCEFVYFQPAKPFSIAFGLAVAYLAPLSTLTK